jgi:hypothetical protein
MTAELHRDTDLRLTEPMLPDYISEDLERLAAHEEKFKPVEDPYTRKYYFLRTTRRGFTERVPMSWSDMKSIAETKPHALAHYYQDDGTPANKREILAGEKTQRSGGLTAGWYFLMCCCVLVVMAAVYRADANEERENRERAEQVWKSFSNSEQYSQYQRWTSNYYVYENEDGSPRIVPAD